MNEDNIKKLVEKYPNDQELGSKVREMYRRATTNNPKGTSVTSQVKVTSSDAKDDKIDTTYTSITNPHPRTYL